MNDIIIIDGNNVAFRSWKAMDSDPLTFEGQDVSAIFGFLRSIKTLLSDRMLTGDMIVIAWDYGRSTFRSELYPEYKGQREYDESFQSFIDQLTQIQTMMSYLPVYQLKMYKVEADDLIGAVCKLAKNRKKVVVSGDKDLAQLIDEHTSLFKLGMFKVQHMLIEPDNFKEINTKCEIPFNKMVDYKILKGDPSDNITGIKGIGDKTIQKIFEDFGGLDEVLKAAKSGSIEDPKKAKLANKLVLNEKQIELLRKIIDIEYFLSQNKHVYRYVAEELLKPTTMDIKAFSTELKRLNFQSILHTLPSFLKAMNY